MRRRLRRFVLVGLVVTAIDLTVFLGLGAGLDWPWVGADVVAVAAAAIASFAIHRAVTFADDAYALIDHRPGRFALAALPALAADVAVVAVLDAAADLDTTSAVIAKLVATSVASVVRLLTYRRVLFSAVRGGQADRRPPPASPSPWRATVVLPAYRAADIVGDSVAAVRSAVAPMAAEGRGDIEIVVVDDGSADDTAERARHAGADQVIELAANRGKGAAVRAGMLAAQGDAVLFTDVDLAYPPAQLPGIITLVEEGWDVVVGNRRHPDTRTVNRAGVLRELGSLGFNLITMFVLLGHYRDTQCGLKGFRRDVAQEIFGRTRIDGFAFDVEVLHLAERMGSSLVEAPVVLDHVEASTVSIVPQAIRMLRDVLRVRRFSARGGYRIGDLVP